MTDCLSLRCYPCEPFFTDCRMGGVLSCGAQNLLFFRVVFLTFTDLIKNLKIVILISLSFRHQMMLFFFISDEHSLLFEKQWGCFELTISVFSGYIIVQFVCLLEDFSCNFNRWWWCLILAWFLLRLYEMLPCACSIRSLRRTWNGPFSIVGNHLFSKSLRRNKNN